MRNRRLHHHNSQSWHVKREKRVYVHTVEKILPLFIPLRKSDVLALFNQRANLEPILEKMFVCAGHVGIGKKSGWHGPAINPSFQRECCNLSLNCLVYFDHLVTTSYVEVRTQNFLCGYFRKRWKRILKRTETFSHPTKMRCSGSFNHAFAVVKVPAQVFSTSSFLLQDLEMRSITHSTELCFHLSSTIFPKLSVDLQSSRS